MTEKKAYILQTEQLSVGYGDKTVVKDVTISLQPGQITLLVGPNGCGKSTLLKTFTKQLRAQSGKIYLGKEDFITMKEATLAKHISMVMTSPLQPTFMTCKEVVETGRYPYTGFLGILSEEDRAIVDECMKKTHVRELAEQPFSAVSDGQRQRVLLARALCQEPEILILDEPTTYLDLKYKLEFLDMVKALAKEQGIAVLMSLHEIAYAKRIGDICICVRDHHIERIGDPNFILTETYLCKLFNVNQKLYDKYHSSEIKEPYGIKNGKKLRKGYTTGSCVAAGAYVGARVLLEGVKQFFVELIGPTGALIEIPVEKIKMDEAGAKVCVTVKKDAGDDPDVTNGMEILTTVHLCKEPGVTIQGGMGIGRITKPGLEQPIGEAAINNGPRKMIEQALEALSLELDYTGGFMVLVEAPEGEVIANKTFNPKLGIQGGISILGSTGVVEPMSEQALLDTIRTEISVKVAEGIANNTLIITPGNYGRDFLKEQYFIDLDQAVKCSNYIGETLDICKDFEVGRVLLVGHIGKLAKLACGIMNTHSKQADGRVEAFVTCAALMKAQPWVLEKLLETNTTEQALEILSDAGILEAVMEKMTDRILFYLRRRIGKELPIEVLFFSNVFGVLGKSAGATFLLENVVKERCDQ